MLLVYAPPFWVTVVAPPALPVAPFTSVLTKLPAGIVLVVLPGAVNGSTATTAEIVHVAPAGIVPAVIVNVAVPLPPNTGGVGSPTPQLALPVAETSVIPAGKLSVIPALVSDCELNTLRIVIDMLTFVPG